MREKKNICKNKNGGQEIIITIHAIQGKNARQNPSWNFHKKLTLMLLALGF